MKKLSKEKIAKIYASALYDAAVESARIEKIKKDADFLLEVCLQNQDLVKKMASPLLSEDEQKAIWHEIAKKSKLDDETLNCLNIMTEKGRIDYLPEALKNFIHLYYVGNNIAEVKVETVKELSKSQDKKLHEVLQKKLNQNVVIEYVKNPSLLGGMRIQYASEMFDGSLNYKLSCLENLMKGK